MNIKNFIYTITTSLNYNRDTEYTMEVCHRVIKRLDKDYDYRVEHKFDGAGIDNDVDLLMGDIIIAYGDYGTSPRYGWIESIPIRKNVIHTLITRIKDFAYMVTQEV